MTTRPEPSGQELAARVGQLSERLDAVLREVGALGAELRQLQSDLPAVELVSPVEVPEPAVTAAELAELAAPEAEAEPRPASEPEAEAEADAEAEAELPLAAREATAPPTRPERALDLETKIGSVWFNRIGLVSLAVGFAFLARLAVAQMVPWQRVTVSYLGAAVLVALGLWYAERFKGFARPVMGAGLALGFFTSFAGYFVAPMACLPLALSLLLMTAFVAAIFVFAERWRSQTTAGFALLLGYVAAYVASAGADVLVMTAVVFLAATAVALVARHNWLPLGLASVAGAFGVHFLWALRAGEAADQPQRFGLELAFLTTYYLIFLAGDTVFCHRFFQRGAEHFSQRERVTGRALGPSALVLYATLVAGQFQATGAYWSQIHLFLFPLALVQLVVLRFHRRWQSGDGAFYLTASTAFATLGLFSVLGGLALNLALAGEALLLLILGRRLAFWLLRPLAQGVLAVNFVDFWFSDARLLDSWATFLGAVAMATVYFVKARLNETWEPIPAAERLSPDKAAGWWQAFYERLSVPFAHAQTLAGAILLVVQCHQFFGSPWNALAVAMLALVAGASGLLLGSASVLQGAAWLSAGSGFLLVRQAQGAPGSELAWTLGQVATLVAAGLAAAATVAAHRRRRRTFLRFATAQLASTALTGFAAAALGPAAGGIGLFLLALAAPAALWLAVELWPRPRGTEDELDAKQLRFYRGVRQRRAMGGMLAAALGVAAVFSATAQPVEPLVVLSVVTLALGLAAFLRSSPYLLAGLLLHQALAIGLALVFLVAGDPEHSLLRWWLLTETTGAAALLLTACPRWQRASYALGGLAALALALGLFCWLSLLPDQRFAPLALWFLPVAGLYVGVELFRSSPARCSLTLPAWPDRLGQQLFLVYSRGISGVAAIAASTALGLMLGRAFDSHREALWAMAGAALVLLAATLVRNSPYLMAGLATLLGLMTGQRILYGAELAERPLLEWASVTLLAVSAAALLWAAPRLKRASFAWGGVLILTLALSALAEFLFNQRPGPPSGLWLATFAATWLAVEELWRGFWNKDCGNEGWLDSIDVGHLCRRSLALAMVFSAVAAVLLVALTWRQFPEPIEMISVTLVYAVAFVGLTALVKSPAIAAGFAVCLTAAHPLFYLRVGPTFAAGASPLLAIALLVVTLAAGVFAEWRFRHLDRPGQRRPAWWSAWYPYGLGFSLALLFLGPWGQGLLGRPAAGAPVQVALAVLAVALARFLALRWLPRAALAYAGVALGVWAGGAVFDAAHRVWLVPAGVLLAIELMVMERLLSGQDPMVVSRRSPRLVEYQRRLLVFAAAGVMVFAFQVGREVQGSWTTAGWSITALVLMVAGFLWHDRTYRRTALVVFALALVRLVVLDVRRLEVAHAMLALLSLGACLVAVSFLYSRYREEIRRWL